MKPIEQNANAERDQNEVAGDAERRKDRVRAPSARESGQILDLFGTRVDKPTRRVRRRVTQDRSAKENPNDEQQNAEREFSQRFFVFVFSFGQNVYFPGEPFNGTVALIEFG